MNVPDLTPLSMSPAPNFMALCLMIVVAIAAIVSKADMRWLILGATVAFGGLIGVKNVIQVLYGPSREGYSTGLKWIVASQVAAAVAFALYAVLAPRLRWLSLSAVMGSLYAAVCMLSWSRAYEAVDASQPVVFTMAEPLFHWVFLAVAGILFFMGVASLSRRAAI